LELLDRMNPTIEELTAAAEREARKRPEVLRLMTHPGVGPLTALAFVLIIGTWERFPRGKQIGNYVGMIPSEDSSGRKQQFAKVAMGRRLAIRLYWMWRNGWEYSQSVLVRGTARYRTWCEVEHRAFDGASRSLKREFEEVIMVEVLIEEMFGSD
jgi:transposase